MTEQQIADVLRSLAAEYGYVPLAEGEFTAGMFGEVNKMSSSQSYDAMQNLVRAGRIVCVGKRRDSGGHISKAYRVAE